MKNFITKLVSIMTFILLFCLSINGQNLGECGMISNSNESYQLSRFFSNSSDTWLLKYRTPEHWIPDASTPPKTILVNWIICRDNNGQNGWQDTQQFREQVDLMFENINEYYANSLQKGYTLTCEPQYTHITDSKIRFELNEIIFLNNTTFNQVNVYNYHWCTKHS